MMHTLHGLSLPCIGLAVAMLSPHYPSTQRFGVSFCEGTRPLGFVRVAQIHTASRFATNGELANEAKVITLTSMTRLPHTDV